MSQPGNVRYVVVLDDTNFTTKARAVQTNLRQMDIATQSSSRGFGALSTSMNTLGTASQKTGTNMGALNSNFKNVSGGLTKTNTLFGQTSTQATSLGTRVKDLGGRFGGMAVGLSATTSGVLHLAAGFRDYSDAQIAVDRVTRKVSLAQEAVDKTTRKVAEALQKSGKGSKAYTDAIRDQQQAQSMLSIQTELLGEAQERMFDSQTQFVASVIPTVLGAVGTLGIAFKDLGLKAGSITGLFSKLGGGLSSLVPGLITTGTAGTAGGAGLVTLGKGADAAKLSIAGLGGVIAIAAVGLVGFLRVLDDFQLATKTISAAIKGNTLESLKAMRVQIEALTVVKFDDPKSWFNVLGAGAIGKFALDISGAKGRIDEMITSLENSGTASTNAGTGIKFLSTGFEHLSSSITKGIDPTEQWIAGLIKQKNTTVQTIIELREYAKQHGIVIPAAINTDIKAMQDFISTALHLIL